MVTTGIYWVLLRIGVTLNQSDDFLTACESADPELIADAVLLWFRVRLGLQSPVDLAFDHAEEADVV